MADQNYPVGEPISTVTLPAATGGVGALSYTLEPMIAGLTFDPDARTLSGTPTEIGTYEMTYRAEDAAENTSPADAATLTFKITVHEAALRDTAPSFSGAVADYRYPVGEPIEDLTLPAASGGNGALTYSLEPSVPGLNFDAEARTLRGTPTTAGRNPMIYTVADADDNTGADDAATQAFTITVTAAATPATEVAEALAALERTGAIPTLDRSASILGSDSDHDGVRDDVGGYIDSLDDSAAQRASLRQATRALNSALAVGASVAGSSDLRTTMAMVAGRSALPGADLWRRSCDREAGAGDEDHREHSGTVRRLCGVQQHDKRQRASVPAGRHL